MILEKMKTADPKVHALRCADGAVYLSPGLQGRIFCSIGEELIHKLDFELAAHPTDSFNNIGGNSLWPAPEGGAFAYNYPHGTWCVQDGINKVCPILSARSESEAVMVKHITMLNAKGIQVRLEAKREVRTVDISATAAKFNLKAVAYAETDTFTPGETYSTEDVVLNAWSLEQFPGADGIIAFGAFDNDSAKPAQIINDDFYGDPLARIRFADKLFLFDLGGPNRLQIGFKKDCLPRLIGAYDAARGILILRKTSICEGTYVNIADNDQKKGVYSTEDIYSIFNGAAELNFFELETIAPMIARDGKLVRSTLVSNTCIFKGSGENLSALLEKEYGINPKEIVK